MTAPRRSRPRRRVLVLAGAFVLAIVLTACSISTEQQPRPINRETTVAPPATSTP